MTHYEMDVERIIRGRVPKEDAPGAEGEAAPLHPPTSHARRSLTSALQDVAPANGGALGGGIVSSEPP